jgi:hypothetical protein
MFVSHDLQLRGMRIGVCDFKYSMVHHFKQWLVKRTIFRQMLVRSAEICDLFLMILWIENALSLNDLTICSMSASRYRHDFQRDRSSHYCSLCHGTWPSSGGVISKYHLCKLCGMSTIAYFERKLFCRMVRWSRCFELYYESLTV